MPWAWTNELPKRSVDARSFNLMTTTTDPGYKIQGQERGGGSDSREQKTELPSFLYITFLPLKSHSYP